MNRPRSAFAALLAAPVALCLMHPPAAHAQSLDALAESLIRLRGEVEQLNAELDISREESRQQLSALAAQRADLEATVQRQDLSRRELETKLTEARERANEAGVDGDRLAPVLLEAVADLRGQIQAGLPFKVEERLAELDEFRAQLEAGALLPHRGANRLWAFYEDELRLTRENALHSQTIEIGGQRMLVDVAKLGSVMLFFRTQDLRVGAARRGPQGWRWEYIEGADDRRRVLELFDSLRKQIRRGWFELPNALTLSEVAR